MACSDRINVQWGETLTSLVARLKDSSDWTVWEPFYRVYGRVVFGAAVGAGLEPPAAEDVVQETMRTVTKEIGRFQYDREAGSFRAWFMTVARSRITDELRRRARRPRTVEARPDETSKTSVLSRQPDPAPADLERICDEEWRRTILDAAKKHVREKANPLHWQIFDLHVRRELPVEQVCADLGVTSNQVYVVKHRIGEALAREAARLERGEAHPPAAA